MGRPFLTPFFASQLTISKLASTSAFVARATAAASSMWSLCPWVMSTAWTSVGWCHAGGQEGFVFSHGSTSSRLPPGERKRQVPCPSQVMPRDEAIEEVYSWLQGLALAPGSG